jgi:hypothetical protein
LIKIIFLVLSITFNSYISAQSESQLQDKEWKDFKVQPESKKPQTSPDRTATPSNPYQFQSYQSIRSEVNGQVKNCVINNNGYVVRCN